MQAIADARRTIAPDLTVEYGGGGSGKGRSDLQPSGRRLRRLRRRVKDEDKSASPRAASSSTCPTTSRRSPCRTTCPASTSCKLSPATIAGIFQPADHEVERPGDRRRQPRRRRCRTPTSSSVHRSDGSGTTENFTNFLDAPSAPTRRHVEARRGVRARVARRHPGRRRQQRCRPDRSADRGRDRLRRPQRREGQRPDVRLGEEQGRQVRRAHARGDDGRQPRTPTINDDLTFFARLGRRRRRLPDRRPDLDHRLHEAGRPAKAEALPRLPDLPADRRPGGRRRRSTTRRCRPTCRPRRWPTSPRSAADRPIHLADVGRSPPGPRPRGRSASRADDARG